MSAIKYFENFIIPIITYFQSILNMLSSVYLKNTQYNLTCSTNNVPPGLILFKDKYVLGFSRTHCIQAYAA